MAGISPDMAWAASTPLLSSTERVVLMMVVVVLDGARSGRVSQGDVAERCRLGRSTVNRTMAAIAASELIEMVRVGPGACEVTLLPSGVPLRDTKNGLAVPDEHSRGQSGVPEEHSKPSFAVPEEHIKGALLSRSGTPNCAGGAHQGAGGDGVTALKKIPPPTEGGVGGTKTTTTTTTTDYVPDHFATRREPQPSTPSAEIDPARWADLEASIAGRTNSNRGRLDRGGLTDRERYRVRAMVDKHGLDAVEAVVASMPDRVDQPTAMLAKRMERHVEAQQEAQRERARVRRDGLYVPKPALRPEEISDFDVLGALGLKDEAS